MYTTKYNDMFFGRRTPVTGFAQGEGRIWLRAGEMGRAKQKSPHLRAF
jgi:hypothetical protein